MTSHGGLISLDDLKSYRAVERTPIEGMYGPYRIITAPLPSSGGVGLLQMLGMLEGSGYRKSGAGSAAAIHYVAEVMRRLNSSMRCGSRATSIPPQVLFRPWSMYWFWLSTVRKAISLL